MARPSFERTIAFAFTAACMAGIWMKTELTEVLAFYSEPVLLWLAVACHSWFGMGRWREALVTVGAGAVVLALLHWFAWAPILGVLGAVVSLGLLRSVSSVARGDLRRLGIELGLGLGALLAMSYVHDGSTFGLVLSMWSFWLVHAAYPLLVATELSQTQLIEDDFEVAHRRARDLLGKLQRAGIGHV